jgi:hypothetical protein
MHIAPERAAGGPDETVPAPDPLVAKLIAGTQLCQLPQQLRTP